MAEGDIAVLCGLSGFDSHNLLNNNASIDAAIYFDHGHWKTMLASICSNEAFAEVEQILAEAGFELVRIITGPWFTKSKVVNATVEQVQQVLEQAKRVRIVNGQPQ